MGRFLLSGLRDGFSIVEGGVGGRPRTQLTRRSNRTTDGTASRGACRPARREGCDPDIHYPGRGSPFPDVAGIP
jgi:hypothetical protein